MMDWVKNCSLLCILLLSGLYGYGQNHMYSQFFNSPVYLNPALNGQFEGDFRVNLIYRNQYTSISPGHLSYFTASFDYSIPRFGGGIGLMFTQSSEGSAYLKKNSIAGIYSYSVGSEDYVLSFGLQAGVTNRSIDWSKLVFGDQIDALSGYDPNSVSSAELPAYNNKFYFDSGLGINLVVGNFMVGSALQHINKPNESFSGAPAPLPMRTTGHISYKLDLSPEFDDNDASKSYLIPSVVFYKQTTAQSLAAGAEYKRRDISAGLWYRSSTDGPSAIVLSLVFDLFVDRSTSEKFRMGVSHDIPSSKLNYSNTSGTTEGSLSYQTTNPNRDSYRKFEGARRCYDFY
jgi:type IX secretion system PorP/SprF family membrane protein